jgi:hypothetical protein
MRNEISREREGERERELTCGVNLLWFSEGEVRSFIMKSRKEANSRIERTGKFRREKRKAKGNRLLWNSHSWGN